MHMGDILQFPIRQLTIIERLDASVNCIHRLQAASCLPADEMRLEALGARLDMASLRDAMHAVLSDPVTIPDGNGVEYVWAKLERLLDQVATCALYFYEEPVQAEKTYAMRARLRAVCQSTMMELHRMRSLLVPVSYAESQAPG